MSDLILKEIYFKYERKNLTDNEIKKYKMTEREVFQKYDNLSEHELNNQNDKEVSVRINVITSVTVNCTGEKNRAKKKKKKRWIQKKIRVYKIWYNGTQWILNQIKNRKNICKRKILEEHYVQIYEIDPSFHKNCQEKIKVDKNGHADTDLNSENKRQEALEKKNSIVKLLELILIKKLCFLWNL